MRHIALAFCLALLSACAKSSRTCAVCQRAECKGMAFRVILADGKTVETCCPLCGLRYVKNSSEPARDFRATDFATGQWIEATDAVYVAESDVAPCTVTEVKRGEQGCCMFKNYDRCLPSLIAFAARTDAVDFQKKHGGRLMAFQQISVN